MQGGWGGLTAELGKSRPAEIVWQRRTGRTKHEELAGANRSRGQLQEGCSDRFEEVLTEGCGR